MVDIVFDKFEQHYRVPRTAIIRQSRKRDVVMLRQIVAAVMLRTKQYSYGKIGRLLHKDRSTIYNVIRKHDEDYETDFAYALKFDRFNQLFVKAEETEERQDAFKIVGELNKRVSLEAKLDYLEAQLINYKKYGKFTVV